MKYTLKLKETVIKLDVEAEDVDDIIRQLEKVGIVIVDEEWDDVNRVVTLYREEN